jgi:hypothetical protein
MALDRLPVAESHAVGQPRRSGDCLVVRPSFLSSISGKVICMSAPNLLFAYFGPETVLPMTSVVATVLGFAMMFGRHTLRLIVRCCRLILIGSSRALRPGRSDYQGPHKARIDAPHRWTRESVVSRAEPGDQSVA